MILSYKGVAGWCPLSEINILYMFVFIIMYIYIYYKILNIYA